MTDPMRLHALDEGAGPRTVLLLHGMFGSAESWTRVTALLVAGGHRVLALDLPGHGLSARDPESSVERAAEAVVATVQALAPDGLAAAIGHSYGGTVLAAASGRMSSELFVHVDAPLAIEGGHDRAELIAQYEGDRRRRTAEWLRVNRPHYGDVEIAAEARAAERFDPATAAAVSCGVGGEWLPDAGAIVVRADPSDWIADADVPVLERRGVDVRSIPGAPHTVWYGHLEEFADALPEVFARR